MLLVTRAIVIKSNVVTAMQKYILSLLQVHSKGLKFGLYVDLGNETCGGYPGSLGYYATDSVTLSEWGVDFVKVGACGIKDVQSLNNGKYCVVYVHYHHFKSWELSDKCIIYAMWYHSICL